MTHDEPAVVPSSCFHWKPRWRITAHTLSCSALHQTCCLDRHAWKDHALFPHSRNAHGGAERRVLIGGCYGAGVPDISPPPSCSQTLPVVTTGGPVKNPARVYCTQSAARAVDASAPA